MVMITMVLLRIGSRLADREPREWPKKLHLATPAMSFANEIPAKY